MYRRYFNRQVCSRCSIPLHPVGRAGEFLCTAKRAEISLARLFYHLSQRRRSTPAFYGGSFVFVPETLQAGGCGQALVASEIVERIADRQSEKPVVGDVSVQGSECPFSVPLLHDVRVDEKVLNSSPT